MEWFKLLLLAHFTATVFMTGLLWMVQLVHYPLFMEVQPSAFAKYERLHQAKISPIVAPMMLFELFSSLVLVYNGWGLLSLWFNAALVLGIWCATFLIQMPLHFQLAKIGFDKSLIKRLIRTNWFRTIAWTIRTILMFYLIVEML